MAAKGLHLHRLLPQPPGQHAVLHPRRLLPPGDLAVIEESGLIRITGRIKDIIIRGGENIAARDVEDVISGHAAVEYVAAVGMPDPDLGEVICAVIKPKPGRSVTWRRSPTRRSRAPPRPSCPPGGWWRNAAHRRRQSR